MKLMGMGLDFDGNALFQPAEEADAAEQLIGALENNVSDIRQISRTRSEAGGFRGEVERQIEDPGDPRTAGWTYLINDQDPHRDEIETILAPLAELRNMDRSQGPLLYRTGQPADPFGWLTDNYFSLSLRGIKPPQYILIVGDPDMVPFRFQSALDSVANVGRVDFDSLAELDEYVKKVVRLEQAEEPAVDREVIFFAPDGGEQDPTYFSRKYMVKPLAEHVQSRLNLNSVSLAAEEATKANLMEALISRKPALVYTASHGLGATDRPLEVQRQYNGAICCQHQGPLDGNALLAAKDVPADIPFMEGAVFYQFACFGYGTPAVSDYSHWLKGVPERYTEVDFVSSLPKRLLAHPRGPIAYIGHLDTAWLHGFTDVEAPHILDRWHGRIAPFLEAVERLLAIENAGRAMGSMNTRYDVTNAILTNTYDQIQRAGASWEWTDERRKRFLDNWITRGDAQNYMVFGDPAAHVRIPDTQESQS